MIALHIKNINLSITLRAGRRNPYETRCQVAIFNWMGRPNKTTILDRLATMREAAMFVNEWQRDNAFGHLILLLRDVPNGEEQAHEVVFGKENPGGAGSVEEEQHIVARNKTRGLLHESFQTIRTVCMPQPHPDINGELFSSSFAASGVPTRMIPYTSTQRLLLDG